MKVEQLMIRNVETCHPEDSLNTAARIMWERDCGSVPVVVDPDGAGPRVVGMITDRDVCMAAYTQGRALSDMPVRSAMAREVRSCRASDPIGAALKVMRASQVHRLPVLDADDRLVGIIALADIARNAAREGRAKTKGVGAKDLAETVEAIAQPRPSRDVICAA